MSDVLDLSIDLNPPPEGSPPESLASIELGSSTLGLAPHEAGLLIDPLKPTEREELRWYLEDYWQWPYDVFAERARRIETMLLPDVGKRLYKAVFESAGAAGLVQAWRLQPGAQRQISILSDLPRALSLPWELLHDEQGFLALRAQPVSIVRRLRQEEAASLLTSFTPPLRILLVTARPEEEGFVDPRTIARELLEEMQEQTARGAVVLEFLRPPTLENLSERLLDEERPVHVLHFDGHGAFGQLNGGSDGLTMRSGAQGMLAFEDEDGSLDLVLADDLAQVLQGGGVRLAMLTACQSALGAEDDVFSSVATRLIQGGIDAVGAMSASVLVASATRYVEAFYREFAKGTPAPVAQERARRALHVNTRRHLFRRHLDEEGEFVRLRDWWLPHFYQQRPLALRPEVAPSAPESRPLRFTDVPEAPRYGFVGRARELLEIERRLLQKLVVIHGFGGMGKTALAGEAADWLSKTGMYRGACFVSYEGGGDAARLLSALGMHMEVYTGDYDPSDHEGALEKLRPALREHPTLVIADNLESILPRGEAPLEAPDRTKLWDVMLKLAGMDGCGVLATTRDTGFGDARMAGSRQVAHLALEGLHPEDAYALAKGMINDLSGIDPARAPYAELRDLLEQLDHHPLAIQLVLPSLRNKSLGQIREDFVRLLPTIEDDNQTGRNRSLIASLEYSLRRLSDEQRALLVRLTPFEGGASEDDLLVITEIPEAEWAELRQALEQAALLKAEPVGNFVSPFLHFHPTLVPYLRSRPGAEDPALHQRYAARYYAVAGYLYHEDDRNPQATRSLVRRELPNLRRAFNLLLEGGELDAASDMADSISRFLWYFGQRREGEEIGRKVAEALAESTRSGGTLTQAQYLNESNLGEAELERGELGIAYERFEALLARHEALPEDAPLGRGSYEHCVTLSWLARCFEAGGQPAAAEGHLREALEVIEALIAQEPSDQTYIRPRGALLGDLGTMLLHQGEYEQAQEAYEEALKVDQQLDDLKGQAVGHGQLGRLALEQRDYPEAKERYSVALEIFQALNEPQMVAIAWHQLGHVALGQRDWAEAERCYRRSLTIKEQHGDLVGAARTCNQLARVAAIAGHPADAEAWYKRALSVPNLPALLKKHLCSNLADLLLGEVREGRFPESRLTEARRHAERALEICETLDPSSAQIWTTLYILAGIAELQGDAEAVRNYRKREREAYAAFEGNRYHIDQLRGELITGIAAAAQGDEQTRAAVEAALPQIEDQGWRIANATHRIWAGERDWYVLAEGLDRDDAVLILRVLETIKEAEQARQE